MRRLILLLAALPLCGSDFRSSTWGDSPAKVLAIETDLTLLKKETQPIEHVLFKDVPLADERAVLVFAFTGHKLAEGLYIVDEPRGDWLTDFVKMTVMVDKLDTKYGKGTGIQVEVVDLIKDVKDPIPEASFNQGLMEYKAAWDLPNTTITLRMVNNDPSLPPRLMITYASKIFAKALTADRAKGKDAGL